MNNDILRHKGIILLFFALFISGCGYTTHSLLPSEYKSIYVDNFINKINVAAEQYDLRMYRGYRPGMERDITKAVIDKFLSDGNLKLAQKENANLVLSGELTDYRREALRYDANNNVEEYRVVLIVNIELMDTKANKIVWKEKSFSGEATYRTGGSLARSESSAVNDASLDLARRIVERTIEGW